MGNISVITCKWFWIKDKSSLNKKLVKTYGKDSDKECNLEVDVKNPKYLHDLHSDLPFLPKIMKINKCNKYVCNLCDKKTMLFT